MEVATPKGTLKKRGLAVFDFGNFVEFARPKSGAGLTIFSAPRTRTLHSYDSHTLEADAATLA